MTAGFRVVQQHIRDSATKLGEAASGVTKADPSDDVDEIATALAHSQSATAAKQLKSTWSTRFSGWSKDATTEQRKRNKAAENYDAADYASMRRFLEQQQQLMTP